MANKKGLVMVLTNEFFDHLGSLFINAQVSPYPDRYGACPVTQCYFFYVSEEDSERLHRLERFIPVQQYPNSEKILPNEVGIICNFRMFKDKSLKNGECYFRIKACHTI